MTNKLNVHIDLFKIIRTYVSFFFIARPLKILSWYGISNMIFYPFRLLACIILCCHEGNSRLPPNHNVSHAAQRLRFVYSVLSHFIHRDRFLSVSDKVESLGGGNGRYACRWLVRLIVYLKLYFSWVWDFSLFINHVFSQLL